MADQRSPLADQRSPLASIPDGHSTPLSRAWHSSFFRKRDLTMSISKEILEIKNKIFGLEQRIEDMHLDFQKYCKGLETRMPDWEQLQRDLLQFSKRKIYYIVLSNQIDRVLYKFQNRKSICLRLVVDFQDTALSSAEHAPTISPPNKDS